MTPLGSVQLKRSVKATLTSDGFGVLFPKDTRLIVQSADDEGFTVKTFWGDEARIARADGEALGAEYAEPQPEGAAEEPFREEKVWEALRTVFDPEIPVNIVDLGLVYDVRCAELPDGGHSVTVVMTLTAPGCSMSEIIKSDVEYEVYCVSGVKEVAVHVTFEPPWDVSRISEAARLELGLF